MYPMGPFWDRAPEFARLSKALKPGAFGYVTGRRRVGKTALLSEAVRRFGGIYHQAVEGTPRQQIQHLAEEIQPHVPVFGEVTPKDWSEFFGLLAREKLPPVIVFDEFPYWVQGDPALPSILQKWIDHQLPRTKAALLVSGSSQSMLASAFLNPQAPLYGRATFRLDLQPLSFRWFCRALRYDPSDPASFARYSLTGGIPHYWKLLPRSGLLEQADALYFEPSALLAEEPGNWLRDEGIIGSTPKAILDLVGRGVARPGEIAARLGTVHGNLTRPLALLLQLGFLQRELPFGESARTTKKVLYSVTDPALSFYYRAYLPNRERWRLLDRAEKHEILRRQVSWQWEIYCRHVMKGSSRYWERDVELDLVLSRGRSRPLLVAECKWKFLGRAEESGALERLRHKFSRTRLAPRHQEVEFRVLSQKDLARLSTDEEAAPA